MAEKRDEKKGSEGENRSEQQMNQGGSGDLKEREYRDAQGNIHHHTHTSSEQQGREGTQRGTSSEEQGGGGAKRE